MQQPPPPPCPAPRPARRGVLAAGALTLLAACTPSPTVRPRGGVATGGATPPPDPALLAARDTEQRLVGHLDAMLARPAGASPAQLALAKGLRGAHAAHLQLLLSDDPLAASASNTPADSPTPVTSKDWGAAAAGLRSLEGAAARSYRAGALRAEDPATCLLLASLSVFAHLSTAAPRPVATRAPHPAAVRVGERPEALEVLLSRLRALAEGLEVGLGQLPPDDALVATGSQRRPQVLAERDRIAAQLRAADRAVPPAELSYRMPGGFADPAQVRRTWALLEQDVAAAWARLAAAGSDEQRAAALDGFTRQSARPLALGAALPPWPGWA